MVRTQVARRPLRRRETDAQRPRRTELSPRTRRLLARLDNEEN